MDAVPASNKLLSVSPFHAVNVVAVECMIVCMTAAVSRQWMLVLVAVVIANCVPLGFQASCVAALGIEWIKFHAVSNEKRYISTV